jgi:hypothetical protein
MDSIIEAEIGQVFSIENVVKAITIATVEESARAGDILGQLKHSIKVFTDKKKELVKPFKDGIAKLEEEFDPKIDKAKEIQAILVGKITTFQMAEIKRREAEAAEQKKQEWLRLEAEKERLENKAAEENSHSVLNDAIKIEERQTRIAETPVKVNQTIKGEFSDTSIKMVWTYDIENEDLIEREYCSSDKGKIREAVNKGVRDIKGVRIFQKPSLSSR